MKLSEAIGILEKEKEESGDVECSEIDTDSVEVYDSKQDRCYVSYVKIFGD